MIKYNFGMVCELDWTKFLSLKTHNKEVLYKSDFKAFSDLYEYIEKNDIQHLLFDGHEYLLEDSVLHNLYGSAKIRHVTEGASYLVGTFQKYFIDGEMVYCDGHPCKISKDFEEGDLYFFEEITNKKSGKDKATGIRYRRKEGIDYKHHHINLEHLRLQDKRKKKLKRILK